MKLIYLLLTELIHKLCLESYRLSPIGTKITTTKSSVTHKLGSFFNYETLKLPVNSYVYDQKSSLFRSSICLYSAETMTTNCYG